MRTEEEIELNLELAKSNVEKADKYKNKHNGYYWGGYAAALNYVLDTSRAAKRTPAQESKTGTTVTTD